MSKAVQRRRGTTAEHTTFTGALGELTVDTTKDTLVVHDGAAAGGFPLLREDGSNSALAIGSAGTPSLKFTGDPNTGLYSPGADQVAVATNGVGRLFVGSDGKTTLIAATSLEVSNLAGTANKSSRIVSSHYDATEEPLGLIGASHTISDSNVLIGGGFSIVNAASDIRFFTAASTTTLTGTERLRITSAGLVGIGTTSPDTLTHISASAGATLRIESTTTALVENSIVGNIEFEANDASAQGTGIKASIGAYSDVAAGNVVSLRLHAGASTEATGTERYRISGDGQHIFGGVGGISTAERARIDSSGRLLVGTTGTSYDHQFVKANSAGDFTFAIRNNASATSTSASLILQTATSDGTNAGKAVISGVKDGTGSGSELRFLTEPGAGGVPTETCRITSEQKLLVGTTTTTANGGVLQVSNGITFPGTQSACSDANTLDDYEEGTWTPVISDGTNNATMDGQTQARYTKIGNQVTIYAFVITSALGSATGNVRITGLPFIASSVNYAGVTACYGQGLNIAAGQSVGVRPIQSNSYAELYLWDSTGGTTSLQFTEWSADGGIIFSTSYFV